MNIRKIIKFVEGVIRVYRLSGDFHEEEKKCWTCIIRV